MRLACARKRMRAIKRANRAGADARPRAQAPAQDTRELGSRRSGEPGGEGDRKGVEQNGMKERHAGRGGTGLRQTAPMLEYSSPACGRRRERASGRAARKALAGLRRDLPPRPSLSQAKERDSRKDRPHAQTDNCLCVMRMQNMTFHDMLGMSRHPTARSSVSGRGRPYPADISRDNPVPRCARYPLSLCALPVIVMHIRSQVGEDDAAGHSRP